MQLDPLTGVVRLRDHNGTSVFTFDRETSDSHYVTVEAKDVGGQGNREHDHGGVDLRDALQGLQIPDINMRVSKQGYCHSLHT